MPVPDLSNIANNEAQIVNAIGEESVQVYRFISQQYAAGSILNNSVFQFVYRSFYRIDNAGLTPDFKRRYFELLEGERNAANIDLALITQELYQLPNLRGQNSLQFSFATKLANTVNSANPIYDSEVASVFHFRRPSNDLTFEERLAAFVNFYETLRAIYGEIIRENILASTRALFRGTYDQGQQPISDTKILDFVFWKAGKLGFLAGRP